MEFTKVGFRGPISSLSTLMMLMHHLSFLLLTGLAAAAPASSVRGPENGGRPFPSDYTSDQPFVCDWRSLAWEFAKKVQPRHDARITFGETT